MGKPSLVIVLAEDQPQVGFIRRYLYRLGHTRHDVHVEALPSGRGCGEQWVRQRYAKAVVACRSRAAQTALVVAIDAETETVEQRAQQLRQALADAEVPARAGDERIAQLIPKRSIETWVLCLNGERVDEKTDYSRSQGIDEKLPFAATTFFEWSRPNATPRTHCVPSLLAAMPEVRRLK